MYCPLYRHTISTLVKAPPMIAAGTVTMKYSVSGKGQLKERAGLLVSRKITLPFTQSLAGESIFIIFPAIKKRHCSKAYMNTIYII